MRDGAAGQAFRDGLRALERGAPAAAAARFRLALNLERQGCLQRRQLEYLSWFSLSTAMAHGVTSECIRACETAARRNLLDPDMQLNLGRVYLLAGRPTDALAAFECGLRLSPGHASLRAARDGAERRGLPVIRGLPRAHPLNWLLGQLRHALHRGSSRALSSNP
jgi:tetratricopeptide (TPR) repeat protein